MKYIFSLLFLIFSTFTYSQTQELRANNVVANKNVFVNGSGLSSYRFYQNAPSSLGFENRNSSNIYRRFTFSFSSLTPALTRTYTLPDLNGTLALTSGNITGLSSGISTGNGQFDLRMDQFGNLYKKDTLVLSDLFINNTYTPFASVDGNGNVTIKSHRYVLPEGMDITRTTAAGTISDEITTSYPVTLLTRTVSSKDTFNIDLSAWYLTYDLIRIEIYNAAPVTDGAIAQLRVSADGTTYDAGASNYAWMNKLLSSTGFTGDAATTGTALVLSHTDGVDNASNVDFTSTLEIRNPDFSTKHFISINSRYANNGGTFYMYQGAGVRDAQQILRGVQFRFSSGNISKATIKVIGIK